MTDNRKILSLLGLARKAGKVSEGSFKAENSIRSGKAALVIFSGYVAQTINEEIDPRMKDMEAVRW